MAISTTQPPDIDPGWVNRKAKRSDLVSYAQYCPDRPYLELEVPPNILRVRRIVFTTISHDQGFSDSGGDAKGTYSGSFSWFDAAVIAPSGHDRVDRRLLQHNLHAVFEKKKHVNTWDDRRGKADIKRFLRAIRPGDKVCIMPKTRHVGWANHVYEAEIELFGTEEDLLTPLSTRVGSLRLDGSHPEDATPYRAFNTTDEIRLLTLQPGVFDDEIVCELCYARLNTDDRPPYEALSYCWGDASDLYTVTVNQPVEGNSVHQNLPMFVTRNLFDAFRYLRWEDKPRTLWADAICINQADVAERSQQVRLIPQVYTKASGILVWLGQSSEAVVDTFNKARCIQERYHGRKDRNDSEAELKELHDPVLNDGALLVDSELFGYEYFQRTWVLQEVFHASNVSVHCGAEVIGWAPLLRLNQCLLNSMLIPNPVGKHVMPALFAGLFEITESTSDVPELRYKPLRGGLDILDVILRGLDLEASDPRDKIFALLAFGEETCMLDSLPESIRQDYEKDVNSVFTDFTRWWIATHSSLQILSATHMAAGRTWQMLTNNPPAIDDLGRPSWSLWHSGKSFWRRGTLALPDNCPYSAAADTVPNVDLLNQCSDPNILAVQGHAVTKIADISLYPFFHVYNHIENCESVEKCPYSSAHALHEAYEKIFDPLDEYATWRYGAQHQAPDLLAKRRQNSEDVAWQKINDHFKVHLDAIRRTGAIRCHGACYFKGENGRFGLCPPAAEEGDLVVVLHGGNIPYILRPAKTARGRVGDKQSRYYLVGECYLSGCMEGQVIRDNRQADGKLSHQVYHLV